jgi:hypothetical protein
MRARGGEMGAQNPPPDPKPWGRQIMQVGDTLSMYADDSK